MKPIVETRVLLGLILISATAVAQEDDSSGTSGKHFYSNKSEGSVLAEAARARGSVVIQSEEGAAEEGEDAAPTVQELEGRVYTVKESDTLWDISGRLFNDPYVWPRIWSYNPEITNPNWIYPGDYIRLYRSEIAADSGEVKAAETDVRRFHGDVVSRHPQGGLLFHSQGFIDKQALKRAGEVKGAHREVMWLAQYDEAYVEFPDKDPEIGERFSAFSVLGEVESIDDPGTEVGRLVEIKGLVRVTSYDKKTKIARVMIEEALKPIPRGTLIGEVHRNLDLIPTVVNDRNLMGHVIAHLNDLKLSATHQVVFVDKGKKDGVRDGNRFFAVEKRDGLRRINNEPDDHPGFPTEVIAEMRVVEARPHTSTCLITGSVRELEVGQQVELRKGY